MRRRLASLAPVLVLVAGVIAAPRVAGAVAPRATDVAPGRILDVQGVDVGARPGLTVGVPRVMRARLDRFRADLGQSWQVTFRAATGVPSRLWGAGFEVKRSVADGDVALAAAKLVLGRHLDLLAPGAKLDDFVLAANDLDAGIRTVAFFQTHDGKQVISGQVSFRFKHDRLVAIGSEALADVDAPRETSFVSDARARQSVLDAFAGKSPSLESLDAPAILPTFGAGGVVRYRNVRRAVVRTAEPGFFDVFVDARNGDVVATRSRLAFADATLQFRVPERSPSFGDRIDAPAAFANVTIDGAATASDATGKVTFADGAPGAAVVTSFGTQVAVRHDDGPEATFAATLTSGGTTLWDASNDEAIDAQLTAFVSSYRVREFARTFAPTLGFLNAQVQATVNIVPMGPDEGCNAYSDGTTINFFEGDAQCENTGRIPDVVYHEYGHSLHYHAIIPGTGAFEGALSEGVSDYLSATITGDPRMGRGFFYSADPLRDLDPENRERIWPDDIRGEVHADGLIIGGTLWDLRKALIEKLGATEGAAKADELYYQGIRRSVDIPSMYTEVLVGDDDDGNIENGTPNICEINAAFELHGLRQYSADATALGLEQHSEEGYKVSALLRGLFAQCPGDALTAAKLRVRSRMTPDIIQDIPMTVTGTALEGTIPTQTDGSAIEYQIDVDLASSGDLRLPANAADRWYQVYIGKTKPLYCTDFETDPTLQGWTHGLSEGMMSEGADDWEWGRANGDLSNGDPPEAYSGTHVFGNDLATQANFNGLYQGDKTNWAQSPSVPTQGEERVRLQYRRWLNVEDAHFDQATIYVNGARVWQNLDSMEGDESQTHHTDQEWRLHDLDISSFAKSGAVEVKFEIKSDRGLEMGGWTLDDFCVVAEERKVVDPCDDGGCGGAGGGATGSTSSTGAGGGGEADDGDVEGGCGCKVADRDGGETTRGALALLALAGAFVARKRRR